MMKKTFLTLLILFAACLGSTAQDPDPMPTPAPSARGSQSTVNRRANSALNIYKTMPLPSLAGLELFMIPKGVVKVYDGTNGEQLQQMGDPYIIEGPGMASGKIFPSKWAYVLPGSHASGFLRPSDFHVAINKPFEQWMFNTAEGYLKKELGEEITWRLAIHRETGLALKLKSFWQIDPSTYLHELYIGRIESNLFYPFHSRAVQLVYEPQATKMRIVEKHNSRLSNPYFQLFYGPDHVISTNRGLRLNLEIIPTEILERIFLPKPDYVGEYMGHNIPTRESEVSFRYSDGTDYFGECMNAEFFTPSFVKQAKQPSTPSLPRQNQQTARPQQPARPQQSTQHQQPPANPSSRNVTGIVVNQQGEPLLGASVKLNDQTGIAGRGVVTDLEGKFTLTGVPSGSTLTVYYIGYQKQFIMLGDKTYVKVVLKQEDPEIKSKKEYILK